MPLWFLVFTVYGWCGFRVLKARHLEQFLFAGEAALVADLKKLCKRVS